MRDKPVSVPGGDDPKPQLDPDDDPENADEGNKPDRFDEERTQKK